MRKFIAYALVGLFVVAGTVAAVMPTRPAAAAGCNSETTNCYVIVRVSLAGAKDVQSKENPSAPALRAASLDGWLRPQSSGDWLAVAVNLPFLAHRSGSGCRVTTWYLSAIN